MGYSIARRAHAVLESDMMQQGCSAPVQSYPQRKWFKLAATRQLQIQGG
jgi:hypothetical protein